MKTKITDVIKVHFGLHFLIALAVSIAVLCLITWLGIGLCILSIVAFVVINAICVIDAGTAGYLKIFGEPQTRTLLPGLNWIVPFVTVVTIVETKKVPHEHTINDVEALDGFNTGFAYTLHYGFNQQEIWRLANSVNLPIDENYLCVWLKEIFKDETKRYTQQELRENAALTVQLKQDIEVAFLAKVRNMFLGMTGTENILDCLELTIGDIIYDPRQVEGQNKVNEAKLKTAEAEEKKKQAEILAEAKKIARIKEAEAEAEYLRVTLASENDAKARLGEIIARYPGVLKNELAKNFPKVFGGNTMVNLDDLLGNTPNNG